MPPPKYRVLSGREDGRNYLMSFTKALTYWSSIWDRKCSTFWALVPTIWVGNTQ